MTSGVAIRLPMWRRDWLLGATLLLAVGLAYARMWSAGFVWDDNGHVTARELQSASGLVRIWAEPGATQQYYPVLHTVFWLEHRLWGEAPAGYHLINLWWHALAAFLLWRVVQRLELPGAALAAVIFALHPVCVESVAWISEQKNTLSAVFYFSAALAYLRFDRGRRPSWYALATGLFVLALATKSVTATLPAALLVVFWWQRGRLDGKADVRPLAPWFALAAVAGSVTTWMEHAYIGAQGAAFALNPADRVLIAGRALWFYAGKLFWPANLTFIYPRWEVEADGVGQYLFPLAAALVFVGLFALRRRARGLLASALLFAGTLFPALGFINVFPFTYSFVADHFQYLAAAVMIPALVAGGAGIAGRWPAVRGLAAMTGAATVALLAILTWRQTAMYADAESLWRATLERNPDCWMACDNLGNLLLQRGQPEPAIELFRRALAIRPEDGFAHNNLGFVFLHAGQLDEAEAEFAAALRLDPENAEAQNNLGEVLRQRGRPEEAVRHFTRALAIKERYPAAHFNLGLALRQAGRLEEALIHFHRAIDLEPDNPDLRYGYGLALAAAGRNDDAVPQFRTAVALRHDFPAARLNLARALARAGWRDDATKALREAAATSPGDADVHNELGVVLAQAGQAEEAIAEFEQALRINPDHPQARRNLDLARRQR